MGNVHIQLKRKRCKCDTPLGRTHLFYHYRYHAGTKKLGVDILDVSLEKKNGEFVMRMNFSLTARSFSTRNIPNNDGANAFLVSEER